MGLQDDEQVNKNRSFTQSFRHAIAGLVSLVRDERNFRKHLILATLAIVTGLVLRLSLNQWLWIGLAIFSVFGAEVLNTVVEAIVDLLVGSDYHKAAKKAKDVAAGGVLLAALFAVFVAVAVYIPAVFSYLK